MPHPSRTVFTLRAGSLSESDLGVRRIQGRERLSEPFDFTVDFTTASGEFLKFEELIWFDHGADSHTLVLADSANGCTELPGETEVPYRVDERGSDSAQDECRFSHYFTGFFPPFSPGMKEVFSTVAAPVSEREEVGQ